MSRRRAVGMRRVALLAPLLAGCATFSNVRSAEVTEGLSGSAHLTVLQDPGPSAGYLWAAGDLGDCRPCSDDVATLDLSLRYGYRPPDAGYALEAGVGTVGFAQSYLEAFIGFGQGGPVPFGIGARVPIEAEDRELAGKDYRVDARVDVRLGRRVRLVANPGWMYHVAGTPDRPSWLSAFVPAAGVELSWAYLSITPAVGWIVGRGRRGDRIAAELELQDVRISAPTFAVAFTVHGRQ